MHFGWGKLQSSAGIVGYGGRPTESASYCSSGVFVKFCESRGDGSGSSGLGALMGQVER